MLIKVDASGLEWRAVCDLANDEVGIQEIISGFDAHEDNRRRFGLPSRLAAKTFIFRLVYGGSAFAYANDPAFSHISSKESFWQEVIDETYSKYKGIARWHKEILQQVTLTGKIRIPTGREYIFVPERNSKGEMKWPVTTIKNYPVQGFSADLMQLARISAWRRLRSFGLFVGTVHDDLELDVDNNPELCYTISMELEKVFKDIPTNVKRVYGYDLKTPMQGEVSFGSNLQQMKKFNREEGKEQFC